MAILDINQFLERTVIMAPICPRCLGKMLEAPINSFDALKIIFGKKKITKRYRCMDCTFEKINEEEYESN